MIEFTREEFKKKYGVSPGKLFDLTKILTNKHKIEAMQFPDPNRMRIRSEFWSNKGTRVWMILSIV